MVESRLNDERVSVWPQTELVSCTEREDGDLEVVLSNGVTFDVDQVILATGYKVNIAQLPLLAAGNLLTQLETRNGFPVLDDHFETSIPGLFITEYAGGAGLRSILWVHDFCTHFGKTDLRAITQRGLPRLKRQANSSSPPIYCDTYRFFTRISRPLNGPVSNSINLNLDATAVEHLRHFAEVLIDATQPFEKRLM